MARPREHSSLRMLSRFKMPRSGVLSDDVAVETSAPLPAVKPAPTTEHETSDAGGLIRHWVQAFGDLVYDLCESVLWESDAAQIAFRATVRDLKASSGSGEGRFEKHERAWVLQTACQRLRDLARDHGRKVTAAEKLQLDATENVTARLEQFDHYFHRLSVDDQILMLLRDKFGLGYGEISSAMGVPEGSLKVRRQHALRALEEWLWCGE